MATIVFYCSVSSLLALRRSLSATVRPQDFFANQADGAKARGEPPPKKPKNPEEQLQDFMKAVAGDVRAAEEAEEAEAAAFAEERAEREAFEQRCGETQLGCTSFNRSLLRPTEQEAFEKRWGGLHSVPCHFVTYCPSWFAHSL